MILGGVSEEVEDVGGRGRERKIKQKNFPAQIARFCAPKDL
jgi:hypothetical protein